MSNPIVNLFNRVMGQPAPRPAPEPPPDNLAGLTLPEMQAISLNEIIAATQSRMVTMTKKTLIEALTGETEETDPPSVIHRSDGQIINQMEITRDVLGNIIRGKSIVWSYYPTAEVNEIVITELDSKLKPICSETIKHFTDGRQPKKL